MILVYSYSLSYTSCMSQKAAVWYQIHIIYVTEGSSMVSDTYHVYHRRSSMVSDTYHVCHRKQQYCIRYISCMSQKAAVWCQILIMYVTEGSSIISYTSCMSQKAAVWCQILTSCMSQKAAVLSATYHVCHRKQQYGVRYISCMSQKAAVSCQLHIMYVTESSSKVSATYHVCHRRQQYGIRYTSCMSQNINQYHIILHIVWFVDYIWLDHSVFWFADDTCLFEFVI